MLSGEPRGVGICRRDGGAGRHHEMGESVWTRALKRAGCLKYMRIAVV